MRSPLLSFTSRRGETIKGLLSKEMKKFFPCKVKTKCQDCEHFGTCDYVRFFQFQLCNSPFTYTIVPPLNPRSVYCQGENFSFEIRLFGQCAKSKYLVKYLIPAVEQGGLLTGIGNWYLEGLGRFQISRVYAWEQGGWSKIFQEDKGFLLQELFVQSFMDELQGEQDGYTGIRFYTPFCLKRTGSYIKSPGLNDILFFSVMRLRAIHDDPGLKVSQDAFDIAGSISEISSRFEKTEAIKDAPYYIGNMQLEEISNELTLLLKLGAFCHIGKGVTQGYGGYFLEKACN